MAMRKIPDGEDFQHPASFGFHGGRPMSGAEQMQESGAHSFPEDFGFTGSNNDVKPPKVASPKKTAKAKDPDALMADGGHMTHHKDGSVIHHHAGGGRTIVHADGRVERHHPEGGHTVHYPDGRTEMHDSSEYVYRAHGGAMDDDMAEDKAMVENGVHQHESHLHRGEPETPMHLARGGRAPGMRPRIPRAMKPEAEKIHSPINTPPRNPKVTRTPMQDMPGGQMAYGVEPGTESDPAASDQGIPQLAKGGRMHRMRD